MTPRQAVWNHLRNDANVNGLVSGRIYHVTPPQDTPLPLIVIDTISNVDRRDLSGVAWTETRIQVTAIAQELAQAEEIALAVRVSLEGWRGVVGGLRIIDCTVEAFAPLYQDDVGLHHYHVDVMVKHE